MVARCPNCNSRYRIPADKIGPSGIRVRCEQCAEAFRIVSPGSSTPGGTPPGGSTVPPTPTARPMPTHPPAAPSSSRGPRALVAESDGSIAKDISSFLKTWGISPTLMADGGRALLRIFRAPPDLVIVGGHLPAVPGSVLTEILRRADNMKGVRIVRVTALDEPAGVPEFEADMTIEPGDLPEGLAEALERFGIGRRPEPKVAPTRPLPPAPAPKPVEPSVLEEEEEFFIDLETTEAPATPSPAPAPKARTPKPPSDPRLAPAERLARIIVSDIVLYNEDRFDRAMREGNLEHALKAELSEGRTLFASRIPDDIRSERDFIAAELDRVTAARMAREE